MINRIYTQKIVSGLTLDEVAAVMKNDDIEYSADYGFKVNNEVMLIFSRN